MTTDKPCKGMNCGTTTFNHSPECEAEHAAAVAGGYFVKSSQAATEAAKATAQDSAPAELPAQSIKAWTERMHGLKTLSPTHAMQAEIADLRAALAAAPASPQPVAKVLEEIQELQAEIMRVTAANAILIQRIVNGCTAIEVGAMADNDKSPSDYKQGIAKGASDCLKFIQEQRKRAASTPKEK